MRDVVTFDIRGAEEIERALERKPIAVARQIVRRSLAQAALIWKQEMAARVQRGWHVFGSSLAAAGLKVPGGHGEGGREREFGVIARNIQVETQLEGDYSGIATVGPATKAFWARFLEFGTQAKNATANKRAHHATRPYPFIRPAFEERKQEVLNAFIADVRNQLRDDLGLE